MAEAESQGRQSRSFQFRDIRAKSATDAADSGRNAQILLGHGSPKTTEIYLRSKRAQKALGPPNRPQKANVLRFPDLPHRNEA